MPDLRGSSVMVADAVARAAVAGKVALFNPVNLTQAGHDAVWLPTCPDVS